MAYSHTDLYTVISMYRLTVSKNKFCIKIKVFWDKIKNKIMRTDFLGISKNVKLYMCSTTTDGYKRLSDNMIDKAWYALSKGYSRNCEMVSEYYLLLLFMYMM